MYYVTAATTSVLDRGTPQLSLTAHNWRAVASRFALRAKSHFDGITSAQTFANAAFLPQSPASFRALMHNFATAPSSIYVLNLQCVHCRSLFHSNRQITPAVVVWLNAGEPHVPDLVCRLFKLPLKTQTDAFYRRVPFPHNLAALLPKSNGL